MSINRSSYYKWLNRDINQYEMNRDDLLVHIEKEHSTHPSYGYRALAKTIRDKTGWIFSDNLCHKVCKFNDIKSKARHYQYKESGSEHVVYENKIWNHWKTTGPLQMIVSDMTIIAHRGKQYEWTVFLDTYNNSIITYDISSKRGDPKPYYKCRDKLIQLIKKEELHEPVYFRTDQGPVYSSISFNQAFLNSNIIRSMSRAGTPTDNPIIEAMNGWIKAQIRCDYRINDYDDIYTFIKHYVDYYNYERPMYKLNYKSPVEYTLSQGYKILVKPVYF